MNDRPNSQNLGAPTGTKLPQMCEKCKSNLDNSENENRSYPNLVVDEIEVVKVTRVFAM